MTEIAATHSKADIAKGVVKYTMTPGILPRVKEITRGGFGYLAYLIAVVYHSVRILPSNHPFLLPENMGKYGLRDVIAAAANHVKFSKKNIDQIAIFFAIISGVIILALQIVSFLFLILTGDAFAQAIFKLPDDFVDTDMAYHLMREVFGIPEMFGPLEGGRSAIHQAFHMLLHFYNLAILLVAVLVFIYYVIVVVAETAQTGVPFGKRFSHIYAPFRLVMAVGLLVPLNYGINGSQYVTLFAAKLGSNLATNAWIGFNEVVENPTGMEDAALIAESEPPDTVGLVNFMAVAVACKEAYKVANSTREIEIYQEEKTPDGGTKITPVNSGNPTFAGAGTKDVKIVFGAFDEEASDGELGGGEVVPFCGSVVVPITVPMGSTVNGTPGKLQEKYLELITGLWTDERLTKWGRDFACAQAGVQACELNSGEYHPPSTERDDLIQKTQDSIDAIIKQHYEDARKTDFKMKEEILKLGWGGSAKYYNLIAQVNGAYVVATFNVPTNDKWPSIMESVLETKRRSDSSFAGCNMFKPNFADNDPQGLNRDEDSLYLARTLNDVYKYWNCNQEKNAANFFIDTISAIFGLQGLISIRQKAKGVDGSGEVDVHPLAKLSVLGRSLVENAIRSLGFAMGASFAGGVLGILHPHLGESAEAASGMFVSIATIGLSVGFLTYYILPFMPFMYFFFAVGSWVKSIFEAMVGAPLWALAHLRIDGDGLSGKMASNGYFLIFEIFLRPILTLCGLLGGMAIFTALANTLNEIFDVAVLNTARVKIGENATAEEAGSFRHTIDVFFFTVLYAVILYMMAVSSFKMITLVPNSILRWLGTQAQAFSDNAGDPTQGLTQYAVIGSGKIGGEIAQAAPKLTGSLGHGIGGAYRMANSARPREQG